MNSTKHKSVILVFLAFVALMIISVSVVRASGGQSGSQARSLSVSPTPMRVDAFTFCAYQGGTCTVPGTKYVRYGVGTSFSYALQKVTGSIPCTSQAFGGDPMPNTPKDCRYISLPIETFVGWTACANENSVCTVYGGNPTLKLVRYGAGTSFVYKTTLNTIGCTDQAFGSDPAPSSTKQCFFIELPNNSTAWTQCATEGESCWTYYPSTVAYGYAPYSAFSYKSIPGMSVACTNAAFGNPYPGATKACYKAPADHDHLGWVRCAIENGVCVFQGTKTVAYGANGTFTYRNVNGSVACSNQSLGNPIAGVAKTCYYNTTYGE